MPAYRGPTSLIWLVTILSAIRMSSQHKVAVHWFRNGLRFHDNPCLLDACQRSETLIPLYIIDPETPFAQTQGLRPGTIRANFVLESIREMDDKLRRQNSRMLVVLGKHHEVLPRVLESTGATALFYEREAAAPIREADRETLATIEKNVVIVGHETHTLHPMDKYLAKSKGGSLPSTYGVFTKLFQSMTVPAEVDDVKQLPPLPVKAVETLSETFGSNLEVPTLEELGYENAEDELKSRGRGGYEFVGGEDMALKLLADNMKKTEWIATFEKPKTSPNDAVKPSTTALSPCTLLSCIE